MKENPYTAPQSTATWTDSSEEQIRREHIKHEASVKSIGILYFIGAFFVVISAVGITLDSSELPLSSRIGIGVVLGSIGVLQFLVGVGLRRLKSWARIPTGILSGIGLLAFPVGTLINGYILYLVFSTKGSMVFSDRYREVIAATPHIKYRTSIVIWILLGILLLILAVGFVSIISFP